MRMFSTAVAFAAGVLLYQFGVVFSGGVLAALTIPPEYFALFGRGHSTAASALLQIFTLALPIALLVAAGTFAVTHLLGYRPTATLAAILAGLLAGFAYWLLSATFMPVPLDTSSTAALPLGAFEQLLSTPWWATSSVLAPWLGFAAAAWLVLRRQGK